MRSHFSVSFISKSDFREEDGTALYGICVVAFADRPREVECHHNCCDFYLRAPICGYSARGWGRGLGVLGGAAFSSSLLFFFKPTSCAALTEALSGKTEQSDNAASLPRTLSEPKREQRGECATKKWQNKQKSRRQSAAKRGTR